MNVIVGISWPFANGDLHIGHAASSLPGDVIARYHRLKGNNVLMVSGTDSHGTPVTERAKKEGTTPDKIAKHYHEEFDNSFKKASFSYDKYTVTYDEHHKEKAREYFKLIYDNGYI